jgi:hypothetical protein
MISIASKREHDKRSQIEGMAIVVSELGSRDR